MKRSILALTATLLILGPPAARGHELWFEAGGQGLILMRGHETANTDHGQPAVPCPREQIQRAMVLRPDGTRTVFEVGTPLPDFWPVDCAAVLLTVSSGIWTKTPAGTVNRARNETRSPLTSWLSREGIKHIGSWMPALSSPQGDDLEVTPLRNPLDLRRGAKLEVLVTNARQPAADVVVTYAGKARGKTGPDGRIKIRLKNAGRQQIAATLVDEEPTEQYDRIIATATLEFQLEQDHANDR